MAAHYSLVLRSWDDMMPVVRALGGGPLLPRHLHMLLTWLHVSSFLAVLVGSPL